jgi:hypothetical protein
LFAELPDARGAIAEAPEHVAAERSPDGDAFGDAIGSVAARQRVASSR